MVKESFCNEADLGWEDFPGEGNGYPLQHPCLENSMGGEPGGLQTMGSQRVGHD